MASDTLDLIGRLNDAFKSVAVCHCGNGIIDGCCDNHTPSWNPCPDSQLLHDAMNRLTALEARLAVEMAEVEAWRNRKAVDEDGLLPAESQKDVRAWRKRDLDAVRRLAAAIAATDASRRAEKEKPNAQ